MSIKLYFLIFYVVFQVLQQNQVYIIEHSVQTFEWKCVY